MHLGPIKSVVIALYLGRGRTAIMFDPHVQSRLCSTEGTDVITCSMNMQDGYRAHIGACRCATHGITADRTEGCYEIGNPVHGMIGQHTTH